MTEDLETIKNIRASTLSALKSHDGHEWKESAGEMHLQYQELPNWILLYEDSDIAECHRIFTEIVAPLMSKAGECNFTVSYTILTSDEEVFVDFFGDNDEILGASKNPDLIGARPSREKRRSRTIFDNTNSRR